MKILVTGSNGLVGQYLCMLFLERGIDFIATSRGENKNPFLKLNSYENIDICDAITVEKIIEKHRPTSIINTAAMANVDECEKHKNACWEVNVNAVKTLISLCKKYDCHLVHLSTDFVFDGLKNTPYKTDDPTNPVSYYGRSKEQAEKLLQASGLKHWNVVRTIVVYGFLAHMSRSNLVLWAKKKLENGEEIKVVNDQYRMPTYAGDLAKGILKMTCKKNKGIFHLSGGEGFSILEAVKKIAKHFHLNENLISAVSSATLKQTAQRPPKTFFCLEKSKEILGYEPLPFLEGLKKLRSN